VNKSRSATKSDDRKKMYKGGKERKKGQTGLESTNPERGGGRKRGKSPAEWNKGGGGIKIFSKNKGKEKDTRKEVQEKDIGEIERVACRRILGTEKKRKKARPDKQNAECTTEGRRKEFQRKVKHRTVTMRAEGVKSREWGKHNGKLSIGENGVGACGYQGAASEAKLGEHWREKGGQGQKRRKKSQRPLAGGKGRGRVSLHSLCGRSGEAASPKRRWTETKCKTPQ